METGEPGSGATVDATNQVRNALSGRADVALQTQAIHGSVHIHAPAGTPAAVPRQLPGAVGHFVNRLAELSALDASISGASESGSPRNSVSAVTGGPGVGKTALVVHWAHRVRDRFPDGELYVNLRGYDSGTPVQAAQALDGFLRMLDVPAARIPADQEVQAGMYRSLVDGRRMLILLDNASSAAQVRPLLPGSPTCTVVVTSRSRMAGLVARDGARRITLDVLPPDEAVQLLRDIIGAVRVDADPESSAELARRCDYLPLALRIAADRVVTHPHSLLADLVDELSDEQDRLDALAVDEDDLSAVRTVFSWSYRALTAQAARAFRLLGLHSGTDVSAQAAAALLGTSVPAARRLLDTLVGAHLLDETGHHRYQFHDLLRMYAAELAATEEPEDECVAAVGRVLSWYLHSAYAAARALPQRHYVRPEAAHRGIRPQVFSSHEQALEWCETERANLVAAVTHAIHVGDDRAAWQLALVLGSFFNLRKHWSDWIVTHELGLKAAERTANLAGQGWLLTGLGTAFRDLGRLDEAVGYQRRAAELFAQIAEPDGIASSRNNLAGALHSLGHLSEALTEYDIAIATYRAGRNRQSEGRAMSNHATVLCDLGRVEEAISELHEALATLEQTDDRHGEGFTLHNLGDAYTTAGRLEHAVSVYLRALALRRATGNLWGEARTLRGLGVCHQGLGESEEAVEAWREAVACYAQTSDQIGHAQVLDLLAKALLSAEEIAEARRSWREALALIEDDEAPLAADIRACLTAIANN